MNLTGSRFSDSVFFIKLCFITIGAKQNVRHPVRGSAHLFTDSFYINSGVAFDNKLIMDMPDDKAVAESFHSIAEDVTADGLNDILHEFRSVGFNAFPLLRRANTFIGNGFSAELIGANPRLHVGKSASGRKLDEKHSAFIEELYTADFSFDPLGDSGFDSTVNVPPECCNHRIRVTPGVYKRLKNCRSSRQKRRSSS